MSKKFIFVYISNALKKLIPVALKNKKWFSFKKTIKKKIINNKNDSLVHSSNYDVEIKDVHIKKITIKNK